jgi:anthranilate phosphoribosyltransferase
MLLAALENRAGPARDIVLFNAGAALYVAGLAASIADGVQRARAVVADGSARQRVDIYVDATRRLAAEHRQGA